MLVMMLYLMNKKSICCSEATAIEDRSESRGACRCRAAQDGTLDPLSVKLCGVGHTQRHYRATREKGLHGLQARACKL